MSERRLGSPRSKTTARQLRAAQLAWNYITPKEFTKIVRKLSLADCFAVDKIVAQFAADFAALEIARYRARRRNV